MFSVEKSVICTSAVLDNVQKYFTDVSTALYSFCRSLSIPLPKQQNTLTPENMNFIISRDLPYLLFHPSANTEEEQVFIKEKIFSLICFHDTIILFLVKFYLKQI